MSSWVISDTQAVEPSSPSASALRTKRPLRVFLVEDSALIRERLTETLSSLERVEVVGYAETESDALAELGRLDCDAVVLDLQLREGHGFNVLRALRTASDRPRITVLVLSNYATPLYRGRSLEFGADFFFDKSREYDRLCEVLEQLAQQSSPAS
jgi:two-component system, OmpR family, response regulator